ncbi:MAG: DUF5668 domain-containing protein [Dehalococcoidia bacterium]|nr:DUF5668 domain-containing protein [Dehalococcoidia bacterium]MDW8120543.1 DUF5668 domain-containing protein [Chloroflexota bacterium]
MVRLFIGLALVALGTLLLLERLGIVEGAWSIGWPALLIVLGVAVLLGGLLRR